MVHPIKERIKSNPSISPMRSEPVTQFMRLKPTNTGGTHITLNTFQRNQQIRLREHTLPQIILMVPDIIPTSRRFTATHKKVLSQIHRYPTPLCPTFMGIL